MKNPMKRKGASRFIALLVCCCMLFNITGTGVAAAYDENHIELLVDKTYDYEKDSGSKVLSDTEAKSALTERVDLLITASGRDSANTAVTSAEFSRYLGYVNVNLRNGNGTYKAIDFLRAAVAVTAAGVDPTNVNKDVNGNRVDLLYKGVYTRSISTLESEGPKTVAYALIALDVNGISGSEMRASGSKVTRSDLKASLVRSADQLSASSVPDVGNAALVLSALAPYY
ncbi:MAG: hypothetical protein IIY02_06050, partial [Firmicutes bacterium]|nr:hypothetical protein [Bacillota bacterium]